MKFPEAAIRARLAAGYRRENRKHGRGTIDVGAAIKDVKTCLKEIDAIKQAVDVLMDGRPWWEEWQKQH